MGRPDERRSAEFERECDAMLVPGRLYGEVGVLTLNSFSVFPEGLRWCEYMGAVAALCWLNCSGDTAWSPDDGEPIRVPGCQAILCRIVFPDSWRKWEYAVPEPGDFLSDEEATGRGDCAAGPDPDAELVPFDEPLDDESTLFGGRAP